MSSRGGRQESPAARRSDEAGTRRGEDSRGAGLAVRENVRAQLRVCVKRILRKYGYPPDKQEQATQTVIEQAEVLSRAWAAA